MLEDLKGEIKSVSVTKADLAQAVDKLTEVLKLEIKSASVPIEQKISDAMDKLTSATTNKQTTEVGSVSKLRQKSSSKKG
jgi:hypothetical protein